MAEQMYLWNKKYFNNSSNKPNINRVIDIEECVWSPEIGMRGKIDATVECDGKITPLELKTGKVKDNEEHNGQVVLYNHMLSLITRNTVQNGLLLYVRDGSRMKPIDSKHHYTMRRYSITRS